MSEINKERRGSEKAGIELLISSNARSITYNRGQREEEHLEEQRNKHADKSPFCMGTKRSEAT